ncbi:hypothetical protein [Bdellovibrio sp. HCB2-146]|uniref:hypothetical protein n=1 Tax=Bdellovibrio sp. HCB2-146 TaxID=3394362 RepID=UPI0039BCC1DA
MHNFLRLLLFVVSNIFLIQGQAAPLGTIPTIEDRNLRFIFDFRSDLWTSPYTYKSAPVRITNSEIRVPLLRTETWKGSADIVDESLGLGKADFTLGKEKVFIGNNLQSISAGLGLNKEFEGGSSLSFFGAYATASDEPYVSQRDVWVEASVVYYTPQFNSHRWLFAVNQSENRGFFNGKPFPYFGVIHHVSENLMLVYGFPFFRAVWDNPEIWQKSFGLTPFGVNFDLEKNLEDDFVFNANIRFDVRSYLHSTRVDDDDRLYYEEVAVQARIRKILTDTTGVIFGLGYSFNRRLYESETIYSPNSEATQIDSDIFGRLSVEFRL